MHAEGFTCYDTSSSSCLLRSQRVAIEATNHRTITPGTEHTPHRAGGGAWRRPDSRPVTLLACDGSSGSPRCHSFVQQHHCGFGLSKARILSRFSTPLSPSIMKPSEALTIPMQHTPIPIIRMALERGGGVVHMRRPTRARERRSGSRRAPCW